MILVNGALGAFIGGFLDDRLGSRFVIMVSLILLLVASLGIISVDKSHVLFTVGVPEKAAGSGAFSTLGERVYLGFSVLIGLVAGPLQASSRTMLARLAPVDKMTEFFGLFAFSGKLTSFAAPLTVATVTAATLSQRWGIATIALFLVVGWLLMFFVRERR